MKKYRNYAAGRLGSKKGLPPGRRASAAKNALRRYGNRTGIRKPRGSNPKAMPRRYGGSGF